MLKKTVSMLAAMLIGGVAQAHTLWVVPSHYVLSKPGSWIAVDAAASNMTFVPDKGIGLDGLKLYTPDGKHQVVTDVYKGKRKSMADVLLPADGTYRLELSGAPRFFTMYELNGERKRIMADAQARKAQLPAGATKVETIQSRSRSYAYVTVNAPTKTVTQLQGEGLELLGSVHPSDVVAGEELAFVFYLNGKVQADVKGVLSIGGELYRNDAGRIEFTTDSAGRFSFVPEQAGRYLIEAGYSTEIDSDKADKLRESVTYSFEVALP